MYAIVDIETTGSHASANGITEIAICIHNGKKIVERYSTLVNPKRDIPVYISALTGITDDMVKNAPVFDDVAHDVYHLLNNKIFVAHNVNFDYSFVHYHLSAAGYELNCKKLCTVRLGRKIMPGMPSYSLGKLCRHLGIENQSRHRAMGDAEATGKLFSMLLQQDKDNHIHHALKQHSREQLLPPNLPVQDVENLPYTPGVYYFYDSKGKVIYVGKAKNLKKRVSGHFTGNNPGPQRQEFLRNIHRVSYQLCGTELMAFVLEAIEIKRLWPRYNRSLKRFEHAYGLYVFEDQRGYQRLAVDKRHKTMTTIYSCNTLAEGRSVLMQLIDTFELCPKRCFIQHGDEPCISIAGRKCACQANEPPEVYNERVLRAVGKLNSALPTFAVRDAGRTDDEHSCLLVEKGKFYGMGYISQYFDVDNIEQLKNHLTPYPGNDYIRGIVSGYASRHPERKIAFP